MRPGLLILLSSLEADLLLAASSADAGDESRLQASCADVVAEPLPEPGTVLLQRTKQAVSSPLLALLESVGESEQSTIGSTTVCRSLVKVEHKQDPLQEAKAEGDESAPAQEIFGDQVPLDTDGLKAVMGAGCGFEKELFVGRVVKELGLHVKNDTALHEWMPDGVYSAKPETFEDLKAIVAKAAEDRSVRWLTHSKAPVAAGDENAIPDAKPPVEDALVAVAADATPVLQAEDTIPDATPHQDEIPDAEPHEDAIPDAIPDKNPDLNLIEDQSPEFPTLLKALGLVSLPHSHPGLAFMSMSGETKPASTKKKKAKVIAAALRMIKEDEDDEDSDEANEDGIVTLDDEDEDEEKKAGSRKANLLSKSKKWHSRAKENADAEDEDEDEDEGNSKNKKKQKQKAKTRTQKPQSMMHKQTKKKNGKEDDAEEDEDGGGASGKSASLNQKGYAAVSKLRSLLDMMAFMKRAIQDRGLVVVDEGALKGVVPYYSGHKSVQSWKALSKELDKAQKLKKSWLAPKGAQDEDEDNEDEDGDNSDRPRYIPYSERNPRLSLAGTTETSVDQFASDEDFSKKHAASDDGFSEEQVAEVVGLESRPELEGSLVTLHFFDPAVARWAVSLETGESIRVRATNLRHSSLKPKPKPKAPATGTHAAKRKKTHA